MQPKLKVETMATEELAPYAHNARVHTAAQVDTIAESIKQFGFNDPVGVWTNPDGVLEIVEGHGRVMAAKQLGLDKIPVIRLDHLDDDGRRAYTHVHNQTTDNSVFDFSILDGELDALDFDWDAFGFPSTVEPIEVDEVKPEIPFANELGAENNYIVLKFDNDIDWINAQTVFDIHRVRRFSTRVDGYLSDGMTHIGTGRVIDGAEAINRLIGE